MSIVSYVSLVTRWFLRVRMSFMQRVKVALSQGLMSGAKNKKIL